MSIAAKLSLALIVAMSLASPVLAQDQSASSAAQASKQAQQGDYYAPVPTVVTAPTAGELKQAQKGDYYAPVPTVVTAPTVQELKQAQQGDYYAPAKGN
jgi:hypothetical protein